MAENIPQKDSANGVGCCLGGCIIGVSGASSLRLCILDVYACVGRWGALHLHVCTLACMHSCLHAFVHDNVWMSAAGSVCVSEGAAEFS